MKIKVSIYLIFPVFTLLSRMIIAVCPDGSMLYQNLCIWFNSHPSTYYEAELYCQKNNSRMAFAKDKKKAIILKKLALGHEIHNKTWLGMSDRKVEGKWIYSDGTPVTTSDMEAVWRSNRANGKTDQNCGCMYSRKYFQFGDRDCDEKYPSICEMEIYTYKDQGGENLLFSVDELGYAMKKACSRLKTLENSVLKRNIFYPFLTAADKLFKKKDDGTKTIEKILIPTACELYDVYKEQSMMRESEAILEACDPLKWYKPEKTEETSNATLHIQMAILLHKVCHLEQEYKDKDMGSESEVMHKACQLLKWYAGNDKTYFDLKDPLAITTVEEDIIPTPCKLQRKYQAQCSISEDQIMHSACHLLNPNTTIDCPSGTVPYKTKCYWVNYWNRTDFSSADQLCEASKGRLAVVNDRGLVSLVKRLAQSRPNEKIFWLGMSDRYKNGHWMYSNREIIHQKDVHELWMKGEPDGELHANCGVLFAEGEFKLGDDDCRKSYPSICERDPK